MKKLWKTLLAAILCLSLLAPAGALAAQGDAMLAYRDEMTGEGFQDYLQRGAVIGDELVLFGNMGLYKWKVGDADLTTYTWAEDRYAAFIEEYGPDEEDEIEFYASDLAQFSDGTDIYVVVGGSSYEPEAGTSFDGAALAKVVFEGETVTLELVEDGELDWEPLVNYYTYEGDEGEIEDSYANYVDNLVCLDGALYAHTWLESGQTVVTIPLDGSYAGELDDEIEAPAMIAAYKDGKILFVYEEYGDGFVGYRFAAFDPETGEMETICNLQSENYVSVSGIAYSEEEDCLYVNTRGCLQRVDLSTGELSEVNDLPPQFYSETALMFGEYYVTVGGTGVVVRNTDPAQRAQRRLRIYSSGYMENMNKVYHEFSNANGDVSAVLATDYLSTQALVEQMMNRSAEYDVFLLYGTNTAYNSFLERGYMADLSGSEIISEKFDQLYPKLKEEFSYNGKPVAIPVTANSSGLGLNNSALEKAGISADEIPTNWVDFLDQLDEIHARCAEKDVSLFPEYYIQSDIKQKLFSFILQDYMLYMGASDEQMGFNTPILRAVLEKLEEVDFTQFGLPESYEDERVMVYGSEDYLIETYVGRTISDFYSSYTPLLLSLDAQTDPCLGLECTVLFINPYSENQDIALKYIETALSCMGDAVEASLFDVDIEPQRSSYYEESLKSYDDSIAALEEALEEAEESEKQELQERIEEMKHWKDDMIENSWLISAKAIEWYKGNEKYITVYDGGIISLLESSEAAASGVNSIMEQYYDGKIDTLQMVEMLDEKLEMMILEGN